MTTEMEDALWRCARRAKYAEDAKAIFKARARIIELEAALRDMTSNRVHDALCQCFEDWENEHRDYERAATLVETMRREEAAE